MQCYIIKHLVSIKAWLNVSFRFPEHGRLKPQHFATETPRISQNLITDLTRSVACHGKIFTFLKFVHNI